MTLFEVKIHGKSHSAQFMVETCTEKMDARDVRDAIKVLIEDAASMLVRDGIMPVVMVSQATRRTRRRNQDKADAEFDALRKDGEIREER